MFKTKGKRSNIENDGFTLIELTITITLLGVISLIVAGGLRLGSRAWEKGEKKIGDTQSVGIILESIKRQISSALPYAVKEDGKLSPFFFGDKKELNFISLTPLHTDQTMGIVHVIYLVSKDNDNLETLKYIEREIISKPPTIDSDSPEAETMQDLENGLQELSFEYAGLPENEDPIEWRQEWNSRETNCLPGVVKISMTIRGEKQPFNIIIRLPAGSVWDNGIKAYEVS